MFTDKFKETAWILYQASLKHSSLSDDYQKLFEEFEEFKSACTYEDTNVIEETADLIHMVIRMNLRTVKPVSREASDLIIDCIGEWLESKADRQMVERGWND